MSRISFATKPPPTSSVEAFSAMFGAPISKGDIQEIPTELLIPYEGQPFEPYPPDKLKELAADIVAHGILEPVLVRQYVGRYQILAGHNRTNAAKLAGLKTVRCEVKENCDDDEALLIVVNSNLYQREKLKFSEKGFAYKLQLEAKKRKAGRPSENNAAQLEPQKRSNEILAEEVGESRAQIQRFIRLTYLIKPLLDMVDNEEIPFTAAVNISYLKGNEQALLHKYITGKKTSVTLEQSKLLKAHSEADNLSYSSLDDVFGCGDAKSQRQSTKPKSVRIKLEKLEQYISPEIFDSDNLEEYILEAVEYYEAHKGSTNTM